MVALALILSLAGFAVGWTLVSWRPEGSTDEDASSSALTSPEKTTSQIREKATFSLPPEDVPGADIEGLPRYPGSVRIEYERAERDGLEVIRARYLTTDGLDVVRGIYRGIFRAEDWTVGNVEFSEGGWMFFIIDGEREATVEIWPRGSGIEIGIESSEPNHRREPDKPVPDHRSPDRGTAPRPKLSQAPQPPALYDGDPPEDFDDGEEYGDD